MNWNGLLAPAGTPGDIIKLLNKAAIEALDTPELQAQLRQQGALPKPMSPDQFAEYIKSESVKWAGVIKSIKIKMD